jgi:hypothetical protein
LRLFIKAKAAQVCSRRSFASPSAIAEFWSNGPADRAYMYRGARFQTQIFFVRARTGRRGDLFTIG